MDSTRRTITLSHNSFISSLLCCRLCHQGDFVSFEHNTISKYRSISRDQAKERFKIVLPVSMIEGQKVHVHIILAVYLKRIDIFYIWRIGRCLYQLITMVEGWCERDSNLRPSACQSTTVPLSQPCAFQSLLTSLLVVQLQSSFKIVQYVQKDFLMH